MIMPELIVTILTKLLYTSIGIIGISFLIGFHELGHFLFCKLFDIETPTFSIGFGPVIASKKIGETQFTLSAIPLGGYVEIAGSVAETTQPSPEEQSVNKRLFSNKPFYQQLFVMIGGIGFNLIFAYLVFMGVAYKGLPTTPLLTPHNNIPVIQQFATDSIAEKAGAHIGDRIIAANGISIIENSITQLIDIIRQHHENNLSIIVERNGEQHTLIIPTPENTPVLLGVTFERIEKPGAPLQEAFWTGIYLTNYYIKQTAYAFASIINKKRVEGMAGPLMIIHMVGTGATQGISIFFIFLAIISINLAVLNLLPLPIFDGGQILFYGMEALLHIKRHIHLISWIMVLILAFYLSLKDISNIISPTITSIAKKIGLLS